MADNEYLDDLHDLLREIEEFRADVAADPGLSDRFRERGLPLIDRELATIRQMIEVLTPITIQ